MDATGGRVRSVLRDGERRLVGVWLCCRDDEKSLRVVESDDGGCDGLSVTGKGTRPIRGWSCSSWFDIVSTAIKESLSCNDADSRLGERGEGGAGVEARSMSIDHGSMFETSAASDSSGANR